jgi:hypothetical protein
LKKSKYCFIFKISFENSFPNEIKFVKEFQSQHHY